MGEYKQTIRAVNSALPAVVAILVSKNLSSNLGSCSGFFISQDGYVLTNRHVVEDEEAGYFVLWQNKKYPVNIISRDKVTDLAILKIEGKNFPFLKLGDSSKLKLGQTVVAIGNALGEFENTVSRGIISGLSRRIKTDIEDGGQEFFGLIQTDAAINPGNSGGPLIDLWAKAVGVNMATVLGVENISFALPINRAKKIWEDIKKYGRICRPKLGIRYYLVNEEIKAKYNLPFDYGAFIIFKSFPNQEGIIPGGPAEMAKLKEGDIILSIDDKKIDKDFILAEFLEQYKIGEKIKISYWREGKENEVEVELGG